MYKIEFPISNYISESERTLSAYVDLVDKYKEHIDSLYFPLGYVDTDVDIWGIRAPNFIYDNSGMLVKQNVLNWENNLQEMNSFLKLPIKLLMNNIYSSAFSDKNAIEAIKKKLIFYANRFEIESVVVADTQIVPLIKDMGLDVCLSTNSHNSLAELDMIFQLYGPRAIKSFVLQRDLNRQPSKIISYLNKRNWMSKTILLVNEGCVNACPFKQSGDIEISIDHVKNKINKIHTVGCNMLAQNQPWTFLTSQFLSKQMIDTYYPDIKVIKLSGRDKNVSNLKYYLKHWVDGENLELAKIMNVSGGKKIFISDLDTHPTYIKDVMSCNKECLLCDKCNSVYNSLLNSNLE